RSCRVGRTVDIGRPNEAFEAQSGAGTTLSFCAAALTPRIPSPPTTLDATAPATTAIAALSRKPEPSTAEPPTAAPVPDSNSCASEPGSGTRPSARTDDAFSL